MRALGRLAFAGLVVVAWLWACWLCFRPGPGTPQTALASLPPAELQAWIKREPWQYPMGLMLFLAPTG